MCCCLVLASTAAVKAEDIEGLSLQARNAGDGIDDTIANAELCVRIAAGGKLASIDELSFDVFQGFSFCLGQMPEHYNKSDDTNCSKDPECAVRTEHILQIWER